MTRHTLVKLAVGTAVAVVLALWATSTRSPRDETAQLGEPLVANLQATINDTTALRIVEGGDKTVVTLTRNDAGWGVAERAGYPADIGRVREYLIKLAEARLLEAKTANAERHAVLGVEDVKETSAKGLRVEIDGKTPAKIVVGTFSTQGQGTFVRRNDEAQCWLVRGNLVPERQVASWLAKDILDIASDRIMRVELSHAGQSFAVAKTSPEQTSYVVENLPAGRDLVSEYEPNGIASVLAGLKFDDVARADAVVPDPSALLVARFQTFDGLVVEIKGFAFEGKQYAVVSASVDAERADIAARAAQLNAVAAHKAASAPAAAAGDAPATEAQDKPATTEASEDAAPAPKAVTDPAGFIAEQRKAIDDEAAKLNQRSSGWAYVLPAYKYANINKRLEDLLKPKG
jgi:hypothetical protein